MARIRTLGEMRSDVRLRADMPGNQFVTDSEINEYLNQSIAELYDMLVAARGQEYYIISNTYITTPGVETYALQPNYYQTLYVELEYAGSRYRLGSYSLHERAALIGAAPGGGTPAAFRLYANTLSFLPVPDNQYTIRHFFATACPRLNIDSDSFDGINGWEDYAIWRAVMYVRQKEELDVSVCMGIMAQMKSRIEGLAPFRAQQNTERVTSVVRRRQWEIDPTRLLPRP